MTHTSKDCFWIRPPGAETETYYGKIAVGGPQGVVMITAHEAYYVHDLRHERDGLRQALNLTKRALEGITVPIDDPLSVWAKAADIRELLDAALRMER